MQCDKNAKKITIIVCLTTISVGLTVSAVFVPALIAPAVASTLATASFLKSYFKQRSEQSDEDNSDTRNNDNSDGSIRSHRSFCMQAFRKVSTIDSSLHSDSKREKEDARNAESKSDEKQDAKSRKQDNSSNKLKITTRVLTTLERSSPRVIKFNNQEYRIIDNRHSDNSKTSMNNNKM